MQKQIQINTKHRNDIASTLSVGDWVLFNGHKDEVEPIWLGRVVSNSEWEGQGVSQNTTSRIISYSNGAKVSKGEVAIFVIRYEKIDVMSDLLDYWVSRSETKPIVQNN